MEKEKTQDLSDCHLKSIIMFWGNANKVMISCLGIHVHMSPVNKLGLADQTSEICVAAYFHVYARTEAPQGQ